MGKVQDFVEENLEEQNGAFGVACEQEIGPKLVAIASSVEGLSRQIAKQMRRT